MLRVPSSVLDVDSIWVLLELGILRSFQYCVEMRYLCLVFCFAAVCALGTRWEVLFP